jgi:hypothetical protein
MDTIVSLLMGSLCKETDSGQKLSSQGSQLGGLASLLDSNDDGGVMDDVLNLAKKFF